MEMVDVVTRKIWCSVRKSRSVSNSFQRPVWGLLVVLDACRPTYWASGPPGKGQLRFACECKYSHVNGFPCCCSVETPGVSIALIKHQISYRMKLGFGETNKYSCPEEQMRNPPYASWLSSAMHMHID
jgi:hypothetical protein